ncbi:MAG: hypothetical protein H7246_07895 [Phycisphaerae bacterium]|nr:hypothetical protein [Saprospiraceae bacterium]
MNVKRLFGTLLTILGIFGLIYAGFMFINTSGGAYNYKTMSIFGILGLVFFVAGMGLMRTVKDEPA